MDESCGCYATIYGKICSLNIQSWWMNLSTNMVKNIAVQFKNILFIPREI